MSAGSPGPGNKPHSCDKDSPFIYQCAVDAAQLGIWCHDLLVDELFISAILARIVGLPEKPTQLSMKKWQSFIFPEDRQLIADGMAAAIQTDAPIDLEYRLRDCDGTLLWVSSTGRVFRNGAGTAVQAAGVIIDITAKKKTEAAFRSSEERYRQLTEMSPDGILVDCYGRYVYANQAAADILGANSPDDIVGRGPFDFLEQPYQNVIAERANRMLNDNEKVLPITIPFRQLSGASVDVQLTTGKVTWGNQPAI